MFKHAQQTYEARKNEMQRKAIVHKEKVSDILKKVYFPYDTEIKELYALPSGWVLCNFEQSFRYFEDDYGRYIPSHPTICHLVGINPATGELKELHQFTKNVSYTNTDMNQTGCISVFFIHENGTIKFNDYLGYSCVDLRAKKDYGCSDVFTIKDPGQPNEPETSEFVALKDREAALKKMITEKSAELSRLKQELEDTTFKRENYNALESSPIAPRPV